jgi:hypothetical protein
MTDTPNPYVRLSEILRGRLPQIIEEKRSDDGRLLPRSFFAVMQEWGIAMRRARVTSGWHGIPVEISDLALGYATRVYESCCRWLTSDGQGEPPEPHFDPICRRLLDLGATWEGGAARLSDPPPQAPSSPADVPSLPAPTPAPTSGIALEALLDDGGRKILAIARSEKSADQRMREICGVDRRFLGYASGQWASLLDVTDAAVRKTLFWATVRKSAADANEVSPDESD